jgi:hypothetical protein
MASEVDGVAPPAPPSTPAAALWLTIRQQKVKRDQYQRTAKYHRAYI